jgi:hypothetical protein
MGNWKTILINVLLLAVVVNFVSCSRETQQQPLTVNKINLDSISFSNSMKGWELYSWPNGNDWNYSILLGTNRTKSYLEVTTNQIVVLGKDSLKMLLDKFPAGEYLFWAGKGWLGSSWSGQYGSLGLPDNSIVSEIQDYCNQKKLVLTIGS